MPPADGSLICGRSTSVHVRVCSPHTAKLQAASMPIAKGSCMPRAGTQTNGWIVVSPNATYGGRHNNAVVCQPS